MGKSCYLCKKEIGMLAIRQYSKSEIMDLHRQLPDGMTEHDKICFDCRESLPNSSGENPTKRPSDLWYFLPIFFGILGGLVMFFVLKDEDRKMAKDGVILGTVLTVIGSIVLWLSYDSILSSLYGSA